MSDANHNNDTDVLELVRALGQATAGAGAERLAPARERLLAAIAAEPAGLRRRKRLRAAGWSTAVAVAASVAAVLVVVTPLSGSRVPPPTEPAPTHVSVPVAAASTLRSAADVTIHQRPDPPVRPGQYRYIDQQILTISQEGSVDGGVAAAWRDLEVTKTWVPYDQEGTWVQDWATLGKREWLIGGPGDVTGGEPDRSPAHYEALCGDFASVFAELKPSCANMGDSKQPDSAWLATVPREPHKLGRWLANGFPHAAPSAVQAADMLLMSGLAPADLRAALYRALALMPDVKLTDTGVDLVGRKGVAVGATASDGLREELIMDPKTGQYLGFRLVYTQSKPGELPKGTVLDLSTVTTGVVGKVGDTPR